MGSAPTGWIVPKLQQHVLALPFVARSEKLKSVLAHPAGPFTSACSDAALAALLLPTLLPTLLRGA